MRDPYEVLGVDRKASQDEIKKAYRKLAKSHHPDLHPNDKEMESRFKDIAGAYDLLSDTDKRARFDRGEIDASGAETAQHFYRSQAGADDWKYQERYAGPDGFGGFEGMSQEDIGDILNEMFGGRQTGGQQRQMKMRGADANYSLRIGFLEAVRGGNQRITLPDGRSLDVKVPAGMEDGQTLRLAGQGGEGFGGGPRGDAYVTVNVNPHGFFDRKDNDIHVELPVSLPEAILGAKIMVPTVDGEVQMTVPKASNTGKTLRLKGRGSIDRKSGQRGDQYVKLKVVLPDEPDDSLTDFIRVWAPDHGYDPRKNVRV